MVATIIVITQAMILGEKKLPEIHFNPQNKSSYLKPTVVDIVDLPSYSKLFKTYRS